MALGEQAQGTTSLRQGGFAVAVASNTANLFGLILYLALIRLLDKADYGAVGALLALALVGSVPGLALQIVFARRTATTAAADRGALWASLLRRAALVAVGVAVLAAVLSPLANAVLHLDSAAPMLWLACSLAPTTVLFAVAGMLQGAERFHGLSVCLVLVGGGKLLGSVLGVPGGVPGVLFGTAVGALLAGLVAVLLITPELREHWSAGPAGGLGQLLPELRVATSGMFGLLTLQNIDLILARHLLPADESGLYAAGALVARGAFWLLHVVAVVVLPRLAHPVHRRTLLPRALALVAGGGAVITVGALLAGPALLPLAFGADYRELGTALGVFALIGSLVAVAELLLYADLATRHRRIAWGLWATAVTFVVLVYTVGARTVPTIAWLDVLPLTVLVLAGTSWLLAGLRRGTNSILPTSDRATAAGH